MKGLPLSLSRIQAQSIPATKPRAEERVKTLNISFTASINITSGSMIILIIVMETTMQRGSEMTDSIMRITLVLSMLGMTLPKLPRMPKTAMVLVPPIMEPRSRAWRMLKVPGRRKFIARPTAATTLRNVQIASVDDFPMVCITVTMSTLIPASKRMTPRATTLMRGERARKVSLSKRPRTGPTSIPKKSSQMMSGTLVLE